MSYDLAFIGAGNMAEAIARGLISTNTLTPDKMIAADVSDVRRTLFSRDLGIKSVADPVEAAKDASAILLAVKPQQMADALAGIGAVITDKTLVISIAAGINTRFIETNLGLGTHWKVVRTMPNTPMLVGLGAVGIAPGAFATKADVGAASRFFAPAAEVVEVTEDLLDAVTALSGSGPAYVFYLLEHMIAAGVSLGLSKEQSELLAKQTVLGAASMAKTSADSPAELRRKVTSPNGTTQAAIESMDASEIGINLEKAIAAACARSIELGKK
jgi:pyrroline-5-carboxylate reductase